MTTMRFKGRDATWPGAVALLIILGLLVYGFIRLLQDADAVL